MLLPQHLITPQASIKAKKWDSWVILEVLLDPVPSFPLREWGSTAIVYTWFTSTQQPRQHPETHLYPTPTICQPQGWHSCSLCQSSGTNTSAWLGVLCLTTVLFTSQMNNRWKSSFFHSFVWTISMAENTGSSKCGSLEKWHQIIRYLVRNATSQDPRQTFSIRNSGWVGGGQWSVF